MVEIEIITSDECSVCPMARDVCKKVASEFEEVKFKETSVETDEGKKYVEALDIKMTPTILVNGEVRFHGIPREELLRSAVKEKIEAEKNE